MELPDTSKSNDALRRRQRRSRSLLLVLALGFVAFCAAAGALFYGLRPVTLRIAVGPPGSDDDKVVEAMARVFAAESRTVRLSLIPTPGGAEALAMLGGGKADLAVGRADLPMPADTQILAVLRKNYAVLWTPTRRSGKNSKAKRTSAKIEEIGDITGHKVGVIGGTSANIALLKVILSAAGVDPDKVAVAQFGTTQLEDLAKDNTLDAYLAVGPLDSKITADAIAATAKMKGAPKFLAVDASDAIALKHPRYEAEEIPSSVFNPKPAWPEDKVDTVSVSHLILARKNLTEERAAEFYRQLFSLRDIIAAQAPRAAHITKPDTEKESDLSVHRGAAAVINGTERTFLDKYGDYFWFALLILSGMGSAAAWLRRYLNRDERDENTSRRNRILKTTSDVRAAASEEELLALQRKVDSIICETLQCYDEGAIEEEELAVFGLVLELFDHATAERRAALQAPRVELPRGAGGRAPSIVSPR